VKFTYLNTFSKSTKILNFTKIHPVGAELSSADKQTGDGRKDGWMDIRLIVAFRNFAKARVSQDLQVSELVLWLAAVKREGYERNKQNSS